MRQERFFEAVVRSSKKIFPGSTLDWLLEYRVNIKDCSLFIGSSVWKSWGIWLQLWQQPAAGGKSTTPSMTKTIVITSGKGGVGKTNISVNIAVELARRQYRTCLFDADLGLANVNILLGIHPEKTIDDLLFQGASLEQIMAPTEHGVDIIPGSSGVEQMANLDSGQLAGLVESFEALAGYDYFLIDTSSGISRGVISFCLAAAETLLVLTAEATSLADAYAVLKVLSLNNYQGTVKVLVNKCVSIPQAKKTYLHFKSVADKHLNIEVAPGGAVLFDPLITKAVTLQYPAVALYPESIFSQCIRALVANLVRTESLPEDEGGFWSRYVRFVQAELLLPGEPGRVPATPEGPAHRPDHSAGRQPVVQGAEEPACRSGTAGVPAGLQQYAGVFTSGRLPGPLSFYSLLLARESNGDLSLAEMQDFVRYDPACLGRIMQLHAAHSTAGPSTGRTSGIERMVADLGYETVRNVLIGTACHGLLQADSVSEHLAVNDLWSHSCRCGLMSESLAGLIDYPSRKKYLLEECCTISADSPCKAVFPISMPTGRSPMTTRRRPLVRNARWPGRVMPNWGQRCWPAGVWRVSWSTRRAIMASLSNVS